MKVYVVQHCFDYEGCDTEAVFSSKEKADRYAAKQEVLAGQRWRVEEWTVDSKETRHNISLEPLDKEVEQREERPARECDRNETLRKLVE